MKQFFYDFCLVILLICATSLLFGDHQVSQTMFQRSIDDFEKNVSSSQKPKESYVAIQDTSDNHVSRVMKVMSDGCVQVIEFVVLIFSNFVSMILTVVVYY